MTVPVRFTVKINGSSELIADLVDIAKGNPSDVHVESVEPADDVSHLRLGLTDVETLIAILNGVATFAQFSWAIHRHLKDKKSDQVTVQTPVRSVIIAS